MSLRPRSVGSCAGRLSTERVDLGEVRTPFERGDCVGEEVSALIFRDPDLGVTLELRNGFTVGVAPFASSKLVLSTNCHFFLATSALSYGPGDSRCLDDGESLMKVVGELAVREIGPLSAPMLICLS